MSVSSVWLRGERFSTYYLLDTRTGGAPRKFVLEERVPTAGFGQWCGNQFVAVYSEPAGTGVCVQVDRTRFPLDGRTEAKQRGRLLRTLSVAQIAREGAAAVTVRQWTPWRLIRRVLDVSYDELDDAGENFLGEVARLVNSVDVQDFRKRNRPTAGPWQLVDVSLRPQQAAEPGPLGRSDSS